MNATDTYHDLPDASFQGGREMTSWQAVLKNPHDTGSVAVMAIEREVLNYLDGKLKIRCWGC